MLRTLSGAVSGLGIGRAFEWHRLLLLLLLLLLQLRPRVMVAGRLLQRELLLLVLRSSLQQDNSIACIRLRSISPVTWHDLGGFSGLPRRVVGGSAKNVNVLRAKEIKWGAAISSCVQSTLHGRPRSEGLPSGLTSCPSSVIRLPPSWWT